MGALAACALALAATLAPAADAKAPAQPKLVFVRCSSTPFACTASRSTVFRTGRLLVGANGMGSGAKVVFPVRPAGRKAGTRAIAGTLRTKTRILVRVPGDAVSGTIRVSMPHAHLSNAARITVRRAPLPRATQVPAAVPVTKQGSTAFDGNGMWIWYVNKSSGGTAAGIGAQAKAHGVTTVYVKSADGTGAWSQFTPALVSALHAQGLKVCAWQFVYGGNPAGEAATGATAQTDGADCLVIDAEGAYEGKYAQAQTYIQALRAAVGASFPIGLTSFPYVDFHPSLPYSVFMQPGGATFNLPQVYWKTIGDSVDASLAHTYLYNAVYQTPIYPLGQTYDSASAADVLRFRALAKLYGASGISWWDWQEASTAEFAAVGDPLPVLAAPPAPGYPTLKANGSKTGSRGDLVVWAQEHLVGAGLTLTIDGDFGPGTASTVTAFQQANGLTPTGILDTATWPTLLKVKPVTPTWTSKGAQVTPGSGASTARVALAPASSGDTGPRSATLRAKRYEIPAGPLTSPRR